MSTVYQHQLHAHKRRPKFLKWLWLLPVVVLIAGGIAAFEFLKPNTTITNAKTVTQKLSGTASTKTFHEGIFSIALPQGWQFIGEQKNIYDIYHFKSASGGDTGNRQLDVYQDSSLPNFAVNRMLPVEATADGHLIANTVEVSDNCTAYTTGATSGRSTVGQIAKWQGIDFLCDMANPLRNVVGTGSTDGLNTVIIKSETTGLHHYFFTYTENNDKPDYSVFVTALNSFQVEQ